MLVSPSTVAEKIISEKIFSELFEVYGRELLADYGENGAAFQTVMARCQTTEAREKACGVLMELYENTAATEAPLPLIIRPYREERHCRQGR